MAVVQVVAVVGLVLVLGAAQQRRRWWRGTGSGGRWLAAARFVLARRPCAGCAPLLMLWGSSNLTTTVAAALAWAVVGVRHP